MQQGLGWLIERGVPVILRAEWQETSAKPCDTGSEISVVSKEFPELNWAAVDTEYPSKTGIYEWSRKGLENRGIIAKKWLKARDEKVIAVVSHAGFLRGAVSERRYHNADFRIFDFAEDESEDGVTLIEWELTEKKGGGLGKSDKGRFPGWNEDKFPVGEMSKDQKAGEVVDKIPDVEIAKSER